MMTGGTTLDFREIIKPDTLGLYVSRQWVQWRSLSQVQRDEWAEIRRYVYATDTKSTSNSTLPWKNTTTIPKLCQLTDNLHANYLATLFPKKKWLAWEANTKDGASVAKRDAALNYMYWACSQPQFKGTIGKLLQDYIHYGNCFAMPEWYDGRAQGTSDFPERDGYVGPVLKRISPFDIVFNPTATNFADSPKIVRSLLSLGELKRYLDSETKDDNAEEMKALWEYVITYRGTFHRYTVETKEMDESYQVDGFSNFQAYLNADICEILTFYGDIFDYQNNKLLQNHQVMVADRHKIIGCRPNPSYFGRPPIFHAGWRIRPDNLWAMSPLANLVGMQYRIDHVENMKADVLDLITFPVMKEKGYVEDYTWQPMERIRTGDDGDVEMVAPPFQVLQTNIEIEKYEAKMELMAGSPREAMGFRTPGEKTAYEVQRLENAAARIFQSKTVQFEEGFLEPCLNGMLELGRRLVNGPQDINVFDNEFKFQNFLTLTGSDITGAGRVKPVAARHFAERAETIQNVTQTIQNFKQDQLLQQHISSVSLAAMLENLLDLQDYKLFTPFIRVSETAEFQRLTQAAHEQSMQAAQQPSGLTPQDHEHPELAQQLMANGAPMNVAPQASGTPDDGTNDYNAAA